MKPMIKHCENCQWHSNHMPKFGTSCTTYCDVKYQYCEHPRRKAIFCRYYKEKESTK